MKQKFSFWLVIGVSIGYILGRTFCDTGAGMCLGIGVSAIVTLLMNEYKNEN